MICVLGPFPEGVRKKAPREYFTRRGRPTFYDWRNPPEITPPGDNISLLAACGEDEDEAAALESFLLPMLRYNYKRRTSPELALQHSWLSSLNRTTTTTHSLDLDLDDVDVDVDLNVNNT